jgi:hypothetical protein
MSFAVAKPWNSISGLIGYCSSCVHPVSPAIKITSRNKLIFVYRFIGKKRAIKLQNFRYGLHGF